MASSEAFTNLISQLSLILSKYAYSFGIQQLSSWLIKATNECNDD